MRLAALGMSYERVGKTLGFAKSTLCKWLKREEYKRPKLSGNVPELDGAWTRVAGGKVALTGGKALYWCIKELRKGLTHLRTEESGYRATSLLERFNREIRARERMGRCGQSTTC